MGKTTTLILECPSIGRHEFEIDHAERLLNMPNNGGWVLPKESEYELKDGAIIRRNKKGTQGAEKA